MVSAVFLAVGMSQGAIGPVLQDLARQAGTDTVAAAGMLTAIFAASLAAQTVAALVLRRLGHRLILGCAMVLFVLGICGIALAGSLPMLLLAAALKGAGDGALLLTGNILAAEAGPGAGPLNLVNGMFGIGAILSPALVSLAMVHAGSGIPALWSVPFAMLVAAALLAVQPAAPQSPASVAAPRGAPVLRTPTVWVIAGFALAEVSVEMGMATWLPTLLRDGTGLPLAQGAMALSWFWFLLTAARFAAALWARDMAPLLILAACTGTCLAGTLVLAAGLHLGQVALCLAGVTLIGPALGPILPTALAVLRASYPDATGPATGLAFGACNLGGALVPPLLGLVIGGAGPVRGALVLVGLAAALAAVLAVLGRRLRGAPVAAVG